MNVDNRQTNMNVDNRRTYLNVEKRLRNLQDVDGCRRGLRWSLEIISKGNRATLDRGLIL